MCNLTEPVGLSQPTVSHHLKVLTDAGILEREQRGKWAYYSLVSGALAAVAAAISPADRLNLGAGERRVGSARTDASRRRRARPTCWPRAVAVAAAASASATQKSRAQTGSLEGSCIITATTSRATGCSGSPPTNPGSRNSVTGPNSCVCQPKSAP